jgi:protein TonB
MTPRLHAPSAALAGARLTPALATATRADRRISGAALLTALIIHGLAFAAAGFDQVPAAAPPPLPAFNLVLTGSRSPAPAPPRLRSSPRVRPAIHRVPSPQQRAHTASESSKPAPAAVTTFARSAPGPVYNPPPAYPRAARRRGLEGRVTLQVHIDRYGRVQQVAVQISSGHPILDRAAIRTVRRWRFAPAGRNGRAVAAQLQIPVVFRLRGTDPTVDARG